MMMSTQKLTSVVFSIHDGLYKDQESLTPLQKIHVLKSVQMILCQLARLGAGWGIQNSIKGYLNINGAKFKIKKIRMILFEPTFAYARWTLLHHFLYVCLDVT